MILTIDYGTTNLKAALINKEGDFFNYYSEQVPLISKNEIQEVNSSIYLNFLINYLKKIDRKLIEAIIISSNGPSVLSLYSDIKITNNKIISNQSNTRLWMDKRGKKYSKIVSKYYNTYIDGSFFLPSILSIKEEDFATYDGSKYFFTIDGFINYFLTKKAYTVNNANLLKKYYWNDNSLKHFDLDETKFPPFIDCGNIIGNIDSSISKFLDLNENIQVIAGGSDFYYSLIGSNITKENIIADINGTSEGVNLCVKNYIDDNRFLCYEHPLQGYYNLSGVITNAGIAINWIRNILGIEDLDFDTIYSLAEKSTKNNIIFLPYLNGERAPIWDTNATASFFNLTNNSKREDIARAVIEGTIFSFKSVIEEFKNLGCSIEEIHTTTNKEKNNFYYQLKSDILGKKIIVYKTKSVELLGLATMAYKNIYKSNNINEAFNDMKINATTYIPNNFENDYYDEKYNLFKNIYISTKTFMKKI
ncbi:MAG: FGGY-family carbohydrate kinase [Pleomorphochaeta sp.]